MPRFDIEVTNAAWRDLDRLPQRDARRVVARIERLRDNLAGDVRRLRDHTPSYRLRVGDWRVLFEVDGLCVTIYRVLNRRDAYE